MPFIDPPGYGEGENPTPEPPPDENFVPLDGLPRYEIVRDKYRQHLIYGNYEANAAGIMRRISDGKLVTESVSRPWFIKIRTNRGKLGYYQKSRFVWGGGGGGTIVCRWSAHFAEGGYGKLLNDQLGCGKSYWKSAHSAVKFGVNGGWERKIMLQIGPIWGIISGYRGGVLDTRFLMGSNFKNRIWPWDLGFEFELQ